ncbi:hypothetical protein ACQSSU_20350 [Micromonospora echinospora]
MTGTPRRPGAQQVCARHPLARPMEPIHQCSGTRSVRVPLLPSRPTGPKTRRDVPCGQAARWRIGRPDQYRAAIPPGWCAHHAAQILRDLDVAACPDRVPLAAAKEAAWQAFCDNPTPRGPAEQALRAANTALRAHDKGHACPMVQDPRVGG